jgi:hypothetical protein
MTFNGIYSVMSHKIELFITTAVRTSNPISVISLLSLEASEIITIVLMKRAIN